MTYIKGFGYLVATSYVPGEFTYALLSLSRILIPAGVALGVIGVLK